VFPYKHKFLSWISKLERMNLYCIGPTHFPIRFATLNEDQYLHVYMTRLRHKLENDPARPKHLMIELGVGYRLKVD